MHGEELNWAKRNDVSRCRLAPFTEAASRIRMDRASEWPTPTPPPPSLLPARVFLQDVGQERPTSFVTASNQPGRSRHSPSPIHDGIAGCRVLSSQTERPLHPLQDVRVTLGRIPAAQAQNVTRDTVVAGFDRTVRVDEDGEVTL